MQKQSPRVGVFSWAYLCVRVILIKLQNGFVDVALLHFSPVGLLHIYGESSLEITYGGLLLNRDNFICDF